MSIFFTEPEYKRTNIEIKSKLIIFRWLVFHRNSMKAKLTV